jgi:G2/mitotic-specific cyclin 3/4
MMILECCENPFKHHAAVFEKYSDRRYKRAALFVRDEIDRGFTLPSLSSQPRLSLPALEDVAVIAPFETHDALKRLVQIKG